jgi:hypothetical protein
MVRRKVITSDKNIYYEQIFKKDMGSNMEYYMTITYIPNVHQCGAYLPYEAIGGQSNINGKLLSENPFDDENCVLNTGCELDELQYATIYDLAMQCNNDYNEDTGLYDVTKIPKWKPERQKTC